MNIVIDEVKLIVGHNNLHYLLHPQSIFISYNSSIIFLFAENILHLVIDIVDDEKQVKNGIPRTVFVLRYF